MFKEVSGYSAADNTEIRVWQNPKSREIQDLLLLSNTAQVQVTGKRAGQSGGGQGTRKEVCR